jgi:hypothetical protein
VSARESCYRRRCRAAAAARKVDDLVRAFGADTGISKSEVSRICAELDAEVSSFRDRSLGEQAFPYVFLDDTDCKARVDRRVVSQAVVIATGVAADGHREVLGFAVGDSEDGAVWTAFLRSLEARGLAGVQLVISDAHTGLKQAIGAVLIGAAWQRSSADISSWREVHLALQVRSPRGRPAGRSSRCSRHDSHWPVPSPPPPGGTGLPLDLVGHAAKVLSRRRR